jgi:serine/threonine protein kinase
LLTLIVGCLLCYDIVVVRDQSYLHKSDPHLPVRERIRKRGKMLKRQKGGGMVQQMLHEGLVIFGAVDDSDLRERSATKKNSDALPPDCERPEWQERNYPNCNEVHEIDLASVLVASARARDRVDTGYVASGLWRSVWAVDARLGSDPVVLKMMKSEHEVNARNLDRHRRDGLVMEQLSSSPYVVDIYMYCANSVVTEYLPMTLESAILDDSPDGQVANTAKQRVQWALDVARGVQALHYTNDSPIVHADIQAKQFLISPKTGTIKVNDFNRCRFMARNTKTGEACKFTIPSAPGKMRAPEEYTYGALDEKIDMYAVANILYSILTEEKAWNDYSAAETKSRIKHGHVPEIPTDHFPADAPSSVTAALLELTRKTYELYPGQRLSASELVTGLERLLASL